MEMQQEPTNTRRRSILAKVAIVSVLSLALLFFVSYISRGWIRGSILPAYYHHKYSTGLSSSLDRTYAVVAKSTQVGSGKYTKPTCKLTAAKKIHTQVDCWASKSFTAKEAYTSTENISNQLIKLQVALEDDEGWSSVDGLAAWAAYITPVSDASQGYSDITKHMANGTTCTLSLRYQTKLIGELTCTRIAFFMSDPYTYM